MSAGAKATMGVAAVAGLSSMAAMMYTQMYSQSPNSCLNHLGCRNMFRNIKDTDYVYKVDKDSVQIDEENSQVILDLLLNQDSDEVATSLALYLNFYEDGILRAWITEDGSEFRISGEDLPVESDIPKAQDVHFQTFDDRLEIGNLFSSTMDEGFAYTVDYDSFKITQMAQDGTVTMVVNDQNTLYYESRTAEILEAADQKFNLPFWSSIANMSEFFFPKDPSNVSKGISLGAYFPTKNIFGLGEREETLVLQRTDNNPYELWATDHPHEPNKRDTLYGQLPFVTGINKLSAQAFAWINSAHTWVFIEDQQRGEETGSAVNFVTESGALEFFMFASSVPAEKGKLNRAKRIQQKLRTVTGPAFLPPIHTLGFHFSKYAPASSDIIRQRNADFSNYGFPVDVLWMDIQWADQWSTDAGYEYFKFNPQNFTTEGIALMN